MSVHAFDVVIFDMDGVITKTARVHTRAWKLLFDEYLKMRSEREDEPFVEFTKQDYLKYMDGKPRIKGIKSFLASRNIELPLGNPDDTEDNETIHALGHKKNTKFRHIVETEGVEVFPYAIALIESLRSSGIKVGVASSSKNCEFILKRAESLHLFAVRIDGIVAAQRGLLGKPEGDIFVTAARELGCVPGRGVVYEDAISGVQAGRNGNFGLVVGVARSDNVEELNRNGADVTVTSMGAISIEWIDRWFRKQPLALFDVWDDAVRLRRQYEEFQTGSQLTLNPRLFRTPYQIFTTAKQLVFFLDYDGTLSPLASRPEQGVLPERLRPTLEELSRRHLVVVFSGRQRKDLERLVGVEEAVYAGSHGFEIRGPQLNMLQPKAKSALPAVQAVVQELRREFGEMDGVLIEDKKFSVAVHFRLADPAVVPHLEETITRLLATRKQLRVMSGNKVYEILPAINWDKGRAVRWIMKALKLTAANAQAVFIGDDAADEDAFLAVRGQGVGIVVAEQASVSAADFSVRDQEQVRELLERVMAMDQERFEEQE